MALTAKFNLLSGFTNAQKDKVKEAVRLALLAANTEEFKKRVLNFTYEEQECTGYLWWKKCSYYNVFGFYFADGEDKYTNEEVYNKIMSGCELITPEIDHEMDLKLYCEQGRTSATAYGMPDDDIIHLYSWWVDGSTVSELANTIFHEWLHKVCFEHTFERSYEREFSVPYGVGDIIEDIIDENLKSGEWKSPE